MANYENNNMMNNEGNKYSGACEGFSEYLKENLKNCRASDVPMEENSPKTLQEALVNDIMLLLPHYEQLRGKLKESLEKLHDLPRDEEDENGVRAHDVANHIYDIEQTMAEAATVYGRIFMMDNVLSYIERKPNLADLIWSHQYPGSFSKSLYLEEKQVDTLHTATRRKKIKKIMDKYEGLMPYVEFQSETMDREDFYDEFVRRGKLRF